MKTLVAYSSLTGNTKMVAQAIAEELEGVLADVMQQPNQADYDFIAVGFWVDRGTADAKAAEYLKGLKNKRVALFATLGADPSSEHARRSLQNAAALLDASNTYCGDFICQGKVDPKLIEKMAKLFPHERRTAGTPPGSQYASGRRRLETCAPRFCGNKSENDRTVK